LAKRKSDPQDDTPVEPECEPQSSEPDKPHLSYVGVCALRQAHREAQDEVAARRKALSSASVKLSDAQDNLANIQQVMLELFVSAVGGWDEEAQARQPALPGTLAEEELTGDVDDAVDVDEDLEAELEAAGDALLEADGNAGDSEPTDMQDTSDDAAVDPARFPDAAA
jgi:hypothetical protein